jgi:NADP-dependent aldehyde dehydrogenase
MFADTPLQELDPILKKSWAAFHAYRKMSLKQRASFMKAIAVELENSGDELIQITMRETNLPEARLKGERARTVFQLTSYAEACEEGSWLEARIDTAIPDKTPPRPDIRKYLIPLGPIVVFGSSNFPFAYSTAGGDTACAFAAGCPVIVKAHPAHAETSHFVAQLIDRAAKQTGMPDGIFAHVFGFSNEVGKALVTHPFTKAVGFTGSFGGGKALFDWANQRSEPIPVFSEMGSVNPVFLFPEKLKQSAAEIAGMYSTSITLGVGQFCTNPGLIIGIESPMLDAFTNALGQEIEKIAPGKMLHSGIAKAYADKSDRAIHQEGVSVVAKSATKPVESQGLPLIATVSGAAFIKNPLLHQEVFGPYSLVVKCKDKSEMLELSKKLEGQLTASLMATEQDILDHPDLVESVKNICGRFIVNGVPTGVEVCLSMHHGGPFPATTDSRFTSVGADGIKRFARPIALQNWPNALLPEELKNENTLQIWRTVNNKLTKEKISS